MKYIDVEKLISAIERRIEETKSMKPSFDKFWAGQISAFKGVITIIASLQQEQKAIDKTNYKQGYNDAIKTACNVFCHTGCPHKTDFYNCLNDKCDTWKIFRRIMEE